MGKGECLESSRGVLYWTREVMAPEVVGRGGAYTRALSRMIETIQGRGFGLLTYSELWLWDSLCLVGSSLGSRLSKESKIVSPGVAGSVL